MMWRAMDKHGAMFFNFNRVEQPVSGQLWLMVDPEYSLPCKGAGLPSREAV